MSLYSIRCRALALVDEEQVARVDITVYVEVAGEDAETARALCERRERWKYERLGWQLLKLDVTEHTDS